MTATKHPLDPFLPLLEPEAAAVLTEAEILEVQDMAQLLELSRVPKIGRYLLARLSDTAALIDPGAAEDLVKALRARLRRFAESAEGTWRISARSVRAAKELGITADQILHWLTAHTSDSVPPVLAMAIRNWAGARAKAFYDNVMLLQVDDAKAFEALGQSVRLRPYIKGALAPGTFIVTEDGRKEVANLLRELGVSLDGECRLRPPDEVASNHGEMDHAVRLLKVGGAWPRRRR